MTEAPPKAGQQRPHVIPIETYFPEPSSGKPLLVDPLPGRKKKTKVTKLRDALTGHPCTYRYDTRKHARIPEYIVHQDMGFDKKLVFAACIRSIELSPDGGIHYKKLVEDTKFSLRYVADCARFFRAEGWIYPLKRTGRWAINEDIKTFNKAGKQVVTKIPLITMGSKTVTPAECIVFGRLITMANAKDHWFGTDKLLAKECGCGWRALKEALRGLEQKKFICVNRDLYKTQKRKGHGKTIYWLLKHPLFTAKASGYGEN